MNNSLSQLLSPFSLPQSITSEHIALYTGMPLQKVRCLIAILAVRGWNNPNSCYPYLLANNEFPHLPGIEADIYDDFLDVLEKK